MKTLPFTLSDAKEWTKIHPTPFYIYDEEGIRKCVTDLYKALSWNKGFKEYFAVKALPNPSILRLLHSLGCGTDCASVTEVLLAQKCGITGKEIMFSSNETTEIEYRTALEAGAIINLDDVTHIEYLETLGPLPDTFCCRYNPGKFNITNDIMGHLYDSKFGMTLPQLKEAFAKLKEKGVKIDDIDALSLANQAGSTKAVNIVLMGRLAKYFHVDYDKWIQAIEQCVNAKFIEMNKKAFELGFNY